MATGDYPPTVDDLGTSLRSERAEYHRRVRVLNEDAERRVQAVRDEHAALVGECQQLAARLGAALATAEALREELRLARAAVLNQCGDNLCWLTDQDDWQALPEAEFLESCRRYRNQIAGERGEFAGGMTIAQLEAQVEHLKRQLADYSVSIEVEAHLARMSGEYQRAYETILGPEITAYRASQDAEWGGPAHDDTHAHFEWIAFIRKFVDRAEHYGYHTDAAPAELRARDLPADPERYEAFLIHVAALAIAAIQSTRRKREPKEQPHDG